MSSAKKGLVSGALALGIAGLVSKILGVAYQVPFQNWAGDYTMALYSYAYTIYVVMLYITTAGIPLAMSKLISERNIVRDYAGADQLYSVGARYLSVAGLFTFAIMFGAADVIAWLIGNPEADTPIRALSFSLLVVPLLAAMRGYLQGHQAMAASGNSQVVEQLLRSVFIIGGVFLAVHVGWSSEWVASVATFSALIGALASLIFIARHVLAYRRENRKRFSAPSNEPRKVVFRRILKVAIPITLTSIVLPLSQLVDNFTVTRLLQIDFGVNLSLEEATAQYGILTARAFKLVAMPLALATAVGLSLMPAISEALAARNNTLFAERVKMSFRLTSFFAFPTAIGIYVLADPINITLFENTQGSDTIALAAFMAIFSSYELVTTYILQAMGFMYRPIRYMFVGLIVKFGLNLVLVPFWGINGAAIASVVGYIVSSILNFLAVRKLTGLRLSARFLFAKPLVSAVVMGAAVWVVTLIPAGDSRLLNLLLVLLAGGIGAGAFGAMLILLKGISKDEMKRLPLVKKFVRSE